MTRTALLTLVGLACGLASSLQADVIYTDFYTGTYQSVMYTNSFNTGSGDTVSGLSPSFEFSSAVSEALSEVDFVTSIGDGDQNAITVSLSTTPGDAANVIASHEFDNAMGVLGVSAQIIQWQPVDVNLIANQNYWITLTAPGTGVTWNDNDVTSFGESPLFGYDQLSDGTWQPVDNTLGAIQILGGTEATGSSTPEPGTLILLGIGLLGGLGVRRRSELR